MAGTRSDLRSTVIELLKARSLKHGDFTLASGRRSTYYIDARLTTMSADGLDAIGRLALARIRQQGWSPQSVGGLTLGADPVAYAIALASRGAPPPIDAFTVRKARKEHGTARRVEGCLPAGAEVVVVEDVITTGQSALQAVEAVREAGATVLGVLGVVDRVEGGVHAIERTGVTATVLLTVADLGVEGTGA